VIVSSQHQDSSAHGNSYLPCEAAAKLFPVFAISAKHLGDVEPRICGLLCIGGDVSAELHFEGIGVYTTEDIA
jgi:hypothetical protein